MNCPMLEIRFVWEQVRSFRQRNYGLPNKIEEFIGSLKKYIRRAGHL